MTIQIDNSEIEYFFINELKSDVKKFSEFILSNIEKYKQQNQFNITHLNPKKNSFKLKFDDLEEVKEEDNPFRDINKEKSKWGEFAKKMKGSFTPEMIENLKKAREEARENFIPDSQFLK